MLRLLVVGLGDFPQHRCWTLLCSRQRLESKSPWIWCEAPDPM